MREKIDRTSAHCVFSACATIKVKVKVNVSARSTIDRKKGEKIRKG